MIPDGPVRAILPSEFWPGATARGIAPGLRASGWLVDEIDEQHFFPSAATLVQRAEARLRRPGRVANYQKSVIAAAGLHQAQVLVVVKGSILQRTTLARLRAMGLFLVNYYPDVHFNDISIDRLTEYDLIATTKSFHPEELARRMPVDRIASLHHGYNAELHRPVTPAALQPVDVLYIGNANSYKARLLIDLAQSMPDVKLKVIGNRWDRHTKGTVLAGAVAGYAVSSDYYASEIANAKIILSFHSGPDRKTGSADLVSTRTFEIPACGGFMLHIDNDEVRSLYDVPSEIDTFTSPEDLVTKIRYWLARPGERRAVAARGHARAVPSYSYVERGRELARLVEERMARR